MLIVDRRRDVHDWIVLCPDGEMDLPGATVFRQSVSDLGPAPAVMVDLSQVDFMDSAGLGALIGAVRRIRAAGGEMVIVCPRTGLRSILASTGVDGVVRVVDRSADAGRPAGERCAPGRPV